MKTSILAVVAAFFLGISAIANQLVIDQLPPAVTLASPGPLSGYEVGHRFTTPVDYPMVVKSVEFLLAGDGTAKPGELVVRIYSDSNSLPGTLLATATNAVDVTRTNMFFTGALEAPVAFTFAPTMQAMVGGQNYWVTVAAEKKTGTWNLWNVIGCSVSSPPLFVFRATGQGFAVTPFAMSMRLMVGPADPVPAKYGTMAILPGVKFSTLYSPAVNESGIFAFRAKLTGTNVTSTNCDAIMRYDGGVELVTRKGVAAPGVSGGKLWTLGDPVINRYGEVAFGGKLLWGGAITNINDQGIWTDLNGTLHLACREGAAAVGLPAGFTFKTLQWFHLSDDMLFIGAQAANSTLKTNGVWKFNGGSLSKVCAQGDSITTGGTRRTVKTIGPPGGSLTGNVQSRVASSSGVLVLLVTCTDGYVGYLSF